MDLLCLNTSGELSIDSICQADIISAACSACVINVCLSAIIYIRCTQHIRCGSLLPRHCTRSLLFLVLLLAHLTEMADGALQYLQDQQRPLLIVVPTLSLAGWCVALALVRVIETDGRAGFLSVTGALWLLCGAGKALRLVYLVETGVELRHVRLGATAWPGEVRQDEGQTDTPLCHRASNVEMNIFRSGGLGGGFKLWSSPDLDSNLGLPFLCILPQHDTSTLTDYATEVRCKRKGELRVTEVEEPPRGYRHATAHLFSQATFSWLTGLLWVGYCSPLEIEDLGQLPEEETTERQLNLFNCIYEKEKNAARNENRRVSLWKCYFKSCWRRFLLGGLFKLLGDFVGFVGPLGIMVILEYVAAIQKPPDNIIEGNEDHYPTWSELLSNGYFMGLIVFLSALAQGTLSQSSTHLINVEGIHLKGALQALVYIKALRLCVWSISEHKDEDVSASPEKKDSRPNGSLSPPGNCPSDTKIKGPPGTDMGAITNLMSEDAFNVMSFFWIGHYIWAIPLKLGWSAIIGAAFCILTMTPLQFLIGKKMSSNSKAITELSDERLRRMNEVLQGIKLLKLYGWECIYGTRIIETRKRELGLLDKDAVYWALLTFLTHASSVLVTLVTFGVYFSMEEGALSPGNVFTGLALFNQLTVPLFIFPITVPVIISAMVSH
uniref:(California timema) hypothetical protein n=1 Tax=Timema californicum TaxID=61474 RepID=A0A7R9IYE7_TIMCA|nr:unnamed protein product [Timema californicum]